MTALLQRKSWSPYAVGAAIGVLSWLAFATANRPIGITTAFENSAALAGQAIAGPAAADHAYFRNRAHQPAIDWEWMLVVGVFVGATLSARLSSDRDGPRVPSLWQWRFGPDASRRMIAAFAGGTLMMFGARLADGCTSGHGISGALQLAVSSWLFLILLFASAVTTALLMYGWEGRRHV